jgi:hypothetical protein
MAGVGDGGFCLKNPNPQDISTTEPAHMDKAPERKKGFFQKTFFKTQGPQRGVEPSFKFSAVSDGGENHIPREA